MKINVPIGLCKYQECSRSKECMRFLHSLGEEFNFKSICNEETNYQWFWEGDNSDGSNGQNNQQN